MLLPDGRGILVMIRAYFDESQHDKSGYFCLAGYAFHAPEARRFNKEWQRLFGDRVFHMKEFAHSRGAFDGLSEEERKDLIARAISIIVRTAALGIIAYCDIPSIESAVRQSPVQVVGFNNPYSLCHHNCMAALGDWSRQYWSGDGIAYVFEDGPKKHDAYEFIQDARKIPAFMESYQCASHTFAKKQQFLHLQAADLLAWEWVKCRREAGRRDIRKSLQALFSGRRRLPYQILQLQESDVAPLLFLLSQMAANEAPPAAGPPLSMSGG